MPIKKKALTAMLTAAALALVMPAQATLVVLTGSLDNLQVVAPVYETDSSGNVVLDVDGNPIVIGSTLTKPDGTPISTSTATGFATVTIDTVAQSIATDFSWTGLSGTADRAHLHDAPAGVTRLLEPAHDRFFHEVINELDDAMGNPVGSTVAGGFVACGGDPANVSCAPASGSLHDFLSLDPAVNPSADIYFAPNGILAPGFANFDALVSAFEADGLFLDIHTELYPGGEIRGQLLFNGVPEPATLALLGFGLVGLLASRKRPHKV